MALEFREEADGRILSIHASGKITRADYQEFVPAVEDLIDEHGKIRILFDMHDFHGWQAGALWEDMKFDVRHFNDIDRLAMVGDKAWEHGVALVCKPFTTAKIRYFDRSRSEEAHAWIEEEMVDAAAR